MPWPPQGSHLVPSVWLQGAGLTEIDGSMLEVLKPINELECCAATVCFSLLSRLALHPVSSSGSTRTCFYYLSGCVHSSHLKASFLLCSFAPWDGTQGLGHTSCYIRVLFISLLR